MTNNVSQSQLAWTTRQRSQSQNFNIFSVRQDTSTHAPSQREGVFTVVESADWVNVIALTADHDVVLVRQYRHGNKRITMEIPGGLIDEGEEPIEAGMRELREETGFTSRRWHLLGHLSPNPAFMNNRCFVLLALDAQLTHPQDLDTNEVIEVHRIQLSDIDTLIDSGDIDHTLVISAFYLHNRWLSKHGQQVDPCP